MNTATEILPTLPYRFESVLSNNYGVVYNLQEQNILICELTTEYVPIKHFQEIFISIIPLVSAFKTTKFIFDKQNLRVFHQPSMEWYFIQWKKELYDMGLATHRKILPQNDPAFTLAVEAGRDKILRECKDNIISKLDIQYKDSIHSAIRS